MNLAYRYPTIFWNTANLIIDSGSTGIHFLNDEEEDPVGPAADEAVVDDGEEEEEEVETKGKVNIVGYGKIASAIGRMQERGIRVVPPDINKSSYTFVPDVDNNRILYGLKGIVRMNDSLISDIFNNRPFTSFEDFDKRVKTNKLQMVNLIKSGAFDEFADRKKIMRRWIDKISDTKSVLNMRNVNMLLNHNLIPDELDFQRRLFNYNKYLKTLMNPQKTKFHLDNIALGFYEKYFSMDKLTLDATSGLMTLDCKEWKKTYDNGMLPVKKYIKDNQEMLLEALNDQLTEEVREKYAKGNVEKWSMASLNFYQEGHELSNLSLDKYDLVDFFSLDTQPVVDYTFQTKDGHTIAMNKLFKIAGTVIDKDKSKSLITLLTPNGVVLVKAYGIFAHYDKQTSYFEDGAKKVLEKSWFQRGNMIIVTGMRRGENMFIAKTYKNTPGHHFALIEEAIDYGEELIIREERLEAN